MGAPHPECSGEITCGVLSEINHSLFLLISIRDEYLNNSLYNLLLFPHPEVLRASVPGSVLKGHSWPVLSLYVVLGLEWGFAQSHASQASALTPCVLMTRCCGLECIIIYILKLLSGKLDDF